MNFDEMKNNKNLYQLHWGNLNLDKYEIIPNGKSSSSYSFKNLYIHEKNSKEKTLKKIFNIENDILFTKQFKSAVSGFEKNRILTLHSSALCALLFFYNVTEENPISFSEIPNCIFYKSYFEYKTPVINKPSSMDVVLVGVNQKSGKNVILFLESKFSEYLTLGKTDVSDSYLQFKDLYNDDFLKSIGIRILRNKEGEIIKKIEKKEKDNNSNLFFTLDSINEPAYVDGIKQMISHFIGVNNFSIAKFSEEENRQLDNNSDIYLAEILFDKDSEKLICPETNKSYLKMYSTLYEKLAFSLSGKSKVKILPHVLYYSEILDSNHRIESNIKQFYFGD